MPHQNQKLEVASDLNKLPLLTRTCDFSKRNKVPPSFGQSPPLAHPSSLICYIYSVPKCFEFEEGEGAAVLARLFVLLDVRETCSDMAANTDG